MTGDDNISDSLDAGTLQRAPHMKIGYQPQKVALDQTLPLSVRRFLEGQIEYARRLAFGAPGPRLCGPLGVCTTGCTYA